VLIRTQTSYLQWNFIREVYNVSISTHLVSSIDTHWKLYRIGGIDTFGIVLPIIKKGPANIAQHCCSCSWQILGILLHDFWLEERTDDWYRSENYLDTRTGLSHVSCAPFTSSLMFLLLSLKYATRHLQAGIRGDSGQWHADDAYTRMRGLSIAST